MGRAYLVLHQSFYNCSFESWGENIQILVNGSETVLQAIIAAETQRLRLKTTSSRSRCQPTTSCLKVEYRNTNFSTPQVPILATEYEAVQPARAVVAPGGYGCIVYWFLPLIDRSRICGGWKDAKDKGEEKVG